MLPLNLYTKLFLVFPTQKEIFEGPQKSLSFMKDTWDYERNIAHLSRKKRQQNFLEEYFVLSRLIFFRKT